MGDLLALRHRDTIVGRSETAADSEDKVRVREEVVELLRDRAAARAERQRMVLGKRALALEARRHRGFEELGQIAKDLPRPRVVHPLAGIDDGPLRRHERFGHLRDVARIRRRLEPRCGRVVDRLRDVLSEQIDREFDQHRPGATVLDLGERAAHRVDHRVGDDDLLTPLRDVLEVQKRIEVGLDVRDPPRVAPGQDDDRHRVAVGLGDATEGVLGARAVLHREHADPLAGRDAADGVGHVQTGSLLADDDRADVGFRRGFDDRVDGISDEKLHAFTFEDLRDGRCCLHGPLSQVEVRSSRLPRVGARVRHILRQASKAGEENTVTRDELKRRVDEAIERHAQEIIEVGETIRRHPELGFKESRTAALVESKFRMLGLTPRTGLALTGVRADVSGGQGPGPTFALLGELDGLVVTGHPEADPATGAAHACGHNAQIAGLIGAAIGLVTTKAFAHLTGRVSLMAVLAEEGGDLEWRLNEVREGRLEFLGGKCELLRLGHLDDVDMAMMIHTTSRPEDGKVAVPSSNNGRFGKTVRFVGRAAHAGGAPHLGVNALYAAQIALAAINAQRETFRDEDTIRVHPILTHGGSQVNVIPGEARLETYVRGRTVEAILDASAKVDRALRAGALALGAQVEIETLPGPMPLLCDPAMAKLFETAARGLVGDEHYRNIPHRSGSTDMGDLSQIMPILHPYMGGARGTGHAADYEIVDPHLAYVMPARAMAAVAIDLLWDGAGGAREVIANARPGMTRKSYVEFQRSVRRREVYHGA